MRRDFVCCAVLAVLASCQVKMGPGGPTGRPPARTDPLPSSEPPQPPTGDPSRQARGDDRAVAKPTSSAVTMPDLRGLTRAEAAAALARAGIVGELGDNPDLACSDEGGIVAKGRVCYQSPIAGSTTRLGPCASSTAAAKSVPEQLYGP